MINTKTYTFLSKIGAPKGPGSCVGVSLSVSRALARSLPPLRRAAAAAAAAAAMAPTAFPSLVSADWLRDQLDRPPSELRILAAPYYLPAMKRDGAAEFRTERVRGAAYFDIDGVADPSTGLPHMLPTEAGFAAACDALGITKDTIVVVYDHMGVFSAPRVWWTFKVFGHQRVAVLEGGLPEWKAVGGPTDATAPAEAEMSAATAAARNAQSSGAPASRFAYPAQLDVFGVRNREQMEAALSTGSEYVVDARPAGRFAGRDPEPRPGLRGGHMPGARNVPFSTVLAEGKKFKSREELEEVFQDAGVDVTKPLVGSCGSGLTACIVALAAHQLNGRVMPIYDGSWMEWGARDDTPIMSWEY